MGNAAPPLKRLREESHCKCNVCSLLQALCQLRGVCVKDRGEEVGYIQLDLLRTSLTPSGDAIRTSGNFSSKRTHEHEHCSCASLT